jgi:glycine/D-amino acid oxidase-like deaminating enzyme
MVSTKGQVVKPSFQLTMSLRGGGVTSEVVGAAGRMGSQWLRQDGSVAVPRGVSPGCLSPPKIPIYVATPSKSWNDVYRETIEERREDLVWVGNGLALDEFRSSTLVVPHYGILSVGAQPTTLPSSPPTYIYGRHANDVAKVLKREGVKTEIVASWEKIQIHAAQKLVWASCMWLLCHSSEPPLTVVQVHDTCQDVLVDLVKELLPALEDVVGNSGIDWNDTITYMESYSHSMPNAIPSKILAMDEVYERNGIWLQARSRFPEPLHEELLLKVGGSEILQHAIKEPISAPRQLVRLKDIDLNLWGSRQVSSSVCREAIVIGGGIVGSSVALNLARRGIKVSVFDRLGESVLGATTPASWAWINANQKSPQAYQWLNQLGMHAWRKDPVVIELPNWNGALVQFKDTPIFHGGYSVEGPLSKHRVHELEPQSNFSFFNGSVYFFSDEGCVDPAAAVRSMRQAAHGFGVQFRSGQNVTSLIRDPQGRVTGVQSYSLSGESVTSTMADVVVVAAGSGSAAPSLGGLPLTHSPGQIAFARPRDSSSTRLKRILVDTLRESHVLQRQDGTIVVGGGYLERGGQSVTPPGSKSSQTRETVDSGCELLNVAKQVAPGPVSNADFAYAAEAVRPMPSDGWPAVGYLEPGLYMVG